MVPGMCSPSSDDELIALTALLAEAGPSGVSSLGRRLLQRGSAVALWNENHPPTLDGMGNADIDLKRASGLMAEWRTGDFDLMTVLDRRYPVRLKLVQPVPLLFIMGAGSLDEAAVAVVGSRDASRRGQQLATEVSGGLADRGIAVVSGLATGIDTAAHEAALAAGGRPIGVMGTGINQTFPASNRSLHRRVAAAGVLVSQFFPDSPPSRQTLRMRNATMVGLGRASIVIEAGERSGSRVHARHATELARPLVLTTLVVDSTQWGRQLCRAPGVHVAGSASEALDFVDAVIGDVS
jgi:DNA processing protein